MDITTNNFRAVGTKYLSYHPTKMSPLKSYIYFH
jgi:hypothetical protein